MPAGNETNNFVRDGSMDSSHFIDTTTTPNSWSPIHGSASSKIPNTDTSDKIFVTIGNYNTTAGTKASRAYVCTKGLSGYLLHELRRGVVTSTGSLGGNAEFLRVTSTVSQDVAWVGRHEYSAVSAASDWTEVQYTPPNTTSSYTAGALHDIGKYWRFTGGSGNKWIEFTVPFNKDGLANLQFYATQGSDTDVDVQIDGGAPEVVDLSSASPRIYRHQIRATSGFHTVRVTKKLFAGNLYIFGSNYQDVDKCQELEYPSGFCSWGAAIEYTSNEGASDYAILDNDSGDYGGSFHGGETLVSDQLLVDGRPVSMSTAGLACGSTIQIEQKTAITWPFSASLEVLSTHTFSADATLQFDAVFSGTVNSGTFYTAMHTTPTTYSDLVFPNAVDLSTLPDGFMEIDRSDTVVQKDPSNASRIYTQVEASNLRQNKYKGVVVRKVSGAYNKVYYGPAISGDIKPMKDIKSSFLKLFA